MTWKIATVLCICTYPYARYTTTTAIQLTVKATTDNPQQHIMDRITQKFPTVFDGQIRMMEGEEFHILLVEGAISFCVITPQSVPFAYGEKLIVELELFQEQGSTGARYLL